MRKSNQLSSQLGELEDSIEMAIFRQLKSHESLEDEFFNLGGEQVRIHVGETGNGIRGVLVVGKNPGKYEGTRPLRDININKRLDILEHIEDILHID